MARHLVEMALTVLLAVPWEDRRKTVLDAIRRDDAAIIDYLQVAWREAVWRVNT